jgi:hypothetical protein
MLCFDFSTENGGRTLAIALRTTIITTSQNTTQNKRKKRDSRTNNDLQDIHIKLKTE